MTDSILSVRNLVVEFDTDDGVLRALDGISFDIEKGETLGIVGESGCGKSVTALSIMRLLPQPMGKIVTGSVTLDGINLINLPLEQMQTIRGKRIGMIFQEPMTALNPVHTIGKQLCETVLLHEKISSEAAIKHAVSLLDRVGIPSPDIRMTEYPHQLSGGMRQRVMIAMALSCNPDVLIADEPTTALDVTIQAQILDLIKDLQKERNMSVILITHDLGVIAETSDAVLVMYAGRVAESARVEDLFDKPSHPYTKGLLDSIPRLDGIPKSRLKIIEGMVPGLKDLPTGCRFHNRCPYVKDDCSLAPPEMEIVETSHQVSCNHWHNL